MAKAMAAPTVPVAAFWQASRRRKIIFALDCSGHLAISCAMPPTMQQDA